MKKYFYAILAAAAVISACAKVDVPEDTKIPVDAAKTAFSGTIIQPNGLANTKVYAVDGTLDEHGDGQTNLYWNKGDEIIVAVSNTDNKNYFLADKDGADVYFGFDENKQTLGDISSWLIENDHNGYTAYYPVEYWEEDDFWNEKCFKEVLDGLDASLEKMPLKAKTGSVGTPGHRNRQLKFSSPFAILKIVMPIDLMVDKMKVTAESTAVDGNYTVTITDVSELRTKAKENPNSKTYAIYVPIKPTTETEKSVWDFEGYGYSKLTFNAYKNNDEIAVATMSTYEENANILVDANNIYYFDFRQTHTVETTETEYNISVTEPAVNYLVNVAGNMSTLTLNATDPLKAPAAIFVNVRDNNVGSLTINAPYSHVEVFNGTATSVISKTSNSTFVAKKDFTVTNLTVMKGSVVVEGLENGGANVNNIDIHADAEGFINIDVTGVTVGENVVVINNQSANGTVQLVKATNSKFKIKTGSKPVVEIAGAEVAMIGNKKYYSLAEAIAAVKDNETTITMLGNVDKAAGISVPEGKNFTVDFHGFKYTMECPGAGSAATKTAGFQLLKNSTIVFKNGILECTAANKDKTWSSGDASKGIAIMIQNYADLTLEDITIDATNIAHNNAAVCYALSNNCGKVEYKGTTTIQTAGDDYAFDVCKYMDYSAPTVTWNSTGTVNGGIELSGGTFVVATDLAVDRPIVAIDDKDVQSVSSTLIIKSGATISTASTFMDRTPGISGPGVTSLVQVRRGADLTIDGAGSIEAGAQTYSAVMVTVNNDNAEKTAKLTVNGKVNITGDYYGIVGNGNRHNTEITVNGGNIKGVHSNDNIGIFHPQAGNLTITGGTIEGYNSAVEVRGGTVNITGGNLSCTASPLDVDPNGSGSTTKGAALAIAQHTTKKDINVTVNGGTLTGYKAIAIQDAQNNGTTNVNVTYTAGTLNGGITLGHGTFALGGNLAVTEPVKVIGKTTLDLADYTLSAASGFTRPTAGVIIVNRLGDLTVKGNTNGAIDAKQVYAAVLMTEKTVDTQDTTNPAKLTVESGSLLGLNYGVVGNGSTGRGNTVITVKGGKIKGTSNESAGIYHPQKGTLTIEDGEIEGSTGIYVKSGDVITSVSDGTIKGTGAKNDYKSCTNGFQSTGDAIVFDNCGYPGGKPNAKISGGNFISTNAAQIGNYGYLPTYQPITIDYTGYQGTKPIERTNNN